MFKMIRTLEKERYLSVLKKCLKSASVNKFGYETTTLQNKCFDKHTPRCTGLITGII